MARADGRLGVDCPDGGKEVARLLLVLGVPTIFTHDSKAYAVGSNFSNTSIMRKSREFN